MPRKRHPVTGCQYTTLLGDWLIADDKIIEHALTIDLVALAGENDGDEIDEPKPGYEKVGSTAVVRIEGPTTRYTTSFQSMFGGTSSMLVERSLQMAAVDPNIRAVALKINSPGGTVDGSFDLAERIRRLDKIKPVYAYAEDQCTSAAQLFASQARYTAGNENVLMGSIGVRTHLYDTSKKQDGSGIRLISLKDGKFKDVGLPGKEVTPEEITYLEGLVKQRGELLRQKIAAGRNTSPDELAALEARTLTASEAIQKKLLDKVCSWDDFLEKIRSETMPFSAEQLTQIKTIPGAEMATEANAEAVLLTAATALAQRPVAAAKAPGKLAKGYVDLAGKRLDAMAKAGLCLPPQIEALKSAFVADAVMEDGSIMIPAETVFTVLEANKPNGLTEQRTHIQPEPDPKQDGNPTPEQVAERRNHLKQLASQT